ncbi:hypothetical protein MAR_009847 [Mya arenaria]|uniref:Uncharacterized protein n=1 Tax=Mya arenaria TaxID=6604 RepID=A0ABY7E4G5_MYAAR|nr:hypothetical protein MAR_009847 [Mya arenaria]
MDTKLWFWLLMWRNTHSCMREANRDGNSSNKPLSFSSFQISAQNLQKRDTM